MGPRLFHLHLHIILFSRHSMPFSTQPSEISTLVQATRLTEGPTRSFPHLRSSFRCRRSAATDRKTLVKTRQTRDQEYQQLYAIHKYRLQHMSLGAGAGGGSSLTTHSVTITVPMIALTGLLPRRLCAPHSSSTGILLVGLQSSRDNLKARELFLLYI